MSRYPSGSTARMFAGSASPCAAIACRVRGWTGKTTGRPASPTAPRIAPSIAGSSVFEARWTVITAYFPAASPNLSITSDCSSARTRLNSTASTMTSPVTRTPSRIPSRSRFSTAVLVGQKRRLETWSTTTRFTSSGMARSNDRRPASTWATGTWSFAAARAPASVEFVSP